MLDTKDAPTRTSVSDVEQIFYHFSMCHSMLFRMASALNNSDEIFVLANAVQVSGVPFVLAAGNDSDHADNYSPARVNGTDIYTVSAMDSTDTWASFSNYGNPPIDYCGPGVAVKSTSKDGGYTTGGGTSAAAPHIVGILLLGNISIDGQVTGDPDGDADDIAVH